MAPLAFPELRLSAAVFDDLEDVGLALLNSGYSSGTIFEIATAVSLAHIGKFSDKHLEFVSPVP